MNFATHVVFDYAPGSTHPESSGTISVTKRGSHRFRNRSGRQTSCRRPPPAARRSPAPAGTAERGLRVEVGLILRFAVGRMVDDAAGSGPARQSVGCVSRYDRTGNECMRRLGILIIVMGATLWPAAALAATSAPVLLQSVSNSTTLQGTVSLAVSGNDAYTTAYWPGELTAVDISNPNAPTVVGSTPPTLALENGSNVTISGTDAFVVSKNRNLNMSSNDDGRGNSLTEVDISNPACPTIVGNALHDSSQLFGAYGVAVQEPQGYAYVAAQGLLGGQPTTPDTSFGSFSAIKLSTMAIVGHIDNSQLAATFPNGLNHANSVAISGNYAYVTAWAAHRVTVINITAPSSPSVVTSLSDVADLSDPNDVAVAGHYLYVANQVDFSNQFAGIDISNPASPKVVGTLNNSALEGAYRIRVRGDFAYVSARDANTIAAVDISDPANPRSAGSVGGANSPLSGTSGLDLDPSGRYVTASAPGPNNPYPPFPTSGNLTYAGTISEIELDPSPISVAITSQPTNPTTQTSASFSFSASDDVAAFQCKIDGGSFGLCSGSGTHTLASAYSGLTPGTHTFTVLAINAAGNTSTPVSYTWSVDAAPANSSAPTVTGAPTQGQTLTASTGTWSGYPTPTYGYQWLRCSQSGQNCNPISGSTGTSYTVQSPDVGSTLVVTVTASNSLGSPSAQSQPTAVVQGPLAALHNTVPPVISGTAKAGAKLTATGGLWSANPAATFS